MRIGIDARYLSHGLTGGVRTYVYELASRLPRLGQTHEFIFYVDSKAPIEIDQLPANARLRTLPWSGTLSSIGNDLAIGKWMTRDRVDVAHAPANYGASGDVPLVVTVHDALNLFPMVQHLKGFSTHPRKVAMMRYLGWRTRAAITQATRLLTVSSHARRDIAARSGYPLDRIDVTYEAASTEFGVITDAGRLAECRTRHRLGRPFVLADGIKNPEATLAAYNALPRELKPSVDLVFFSREVAPRPSIAAAVDGQHVRFIPRPSIHDLGALMNLATVFAYPSWYEGFGLSLVESMQCGLPVVASSRGSIPEVLGDAGLIFELEAPAQFTSHLARVLSDPAYRQTRRALSLSRAQAFNWDRTAMETLAVYERAVSGGRQTTS